MATGAANLFGADDRQVHAGGYFGPQPDTGKKQPARGQKVISPKVAWARNVAATLKNERQKVTSEMTTAVTLANGGTPFFDGRPPWKIGTKLNYCCTVPLTWTAILTDAKPSVSYTALDRDKQKRADIATAAWNQAYTENDWEQKIHDAVLVSRVQKVAYLSLRPKLKGDQISPRLNVIPGLQVYKDRNATCINDAEIVYYEYRESYGSLCSRFKGLKGKLQKKYDTERQEQNNSDNQSTLMNPTTYTMPNAAGNTVYNPAYSASPSPPDNADGTSGYKVQEFWTRPHSTIDVEEIQFLTTGEPKTQPKMFKTADPNDEEPLRRIITEGGVIYELPESLVNDLQLFGPIKITSDKPALEVMTHKVKYPLYPDGRLMVIVDEDLEADDRMNPLGYFPFAEIMANSSPDGGQYGPSDVDLIADVYEQLVRLVCLVHDTANLAGNAVWRIPIGAEISNDDITNAPGAIQREDIMCLKLGKREAAPELPNYIPNHIKFLTDQIKELSGLSDVMTGKMPPKAQVSTETMTMNQEASGVRFRDSLANLSRATRTVGAHFLEFMARFYTSPVIVQLKNDAGIPEPVPMLSTYLTDPFIVEAKAGSRQPAGPSARLNALLNLKAAGIPVDLETVYEIMEELGTIQSATGMMRRVEKLKSDPRQLWKLLGLPPPPDAKNVKKTNSKRQKKGNQAA
jgi:hypothetical protein